VAEGVPNPAIGPQGLIPTTTTTSPVQNITRKQMDGPGAAAFQDFVDAEKAKLAAQQGIGGDAPTAADFDAELAQEKANATGSDLDVANAQAQRRLLPDPFEQPTASQRIDAELSQAPGMPGGAAGDQVELDQMMAAAHGRAADAPGLPPEPKPLTYAEAQDKVNAFNAENKAREQEMLRQKQEELQAQKLEAFEKVKTEIADAAAEHLKATESKTRFEEMGTFPKILRILGNAMGAYASIVAGVPNPVQAMIDSELRNDLEQKKMRIASTLERYKIQGAKPAQLQSLYEAQMKDALAKHQANVTQLDLTSQKILSRYPQAQQAAHMALSNADASAKKDIASFALTNSGHTIQDEGRKVQTVDGKTQGAQQPQRESVNEMVAARAQVKLLDEYQDIIRKNPKAWEAYRDATRETSEFKIATEGPMGGVLKAGQSVGLGATPISLDQRLDKLTDQKTRADAKRLNQIFPIIKTGEARILDPVGVLNEGSMQQGMQHLNMNTMTPKEAIDIGEQFKEQARDKADIFESGSMMQRARANVAATRARQDSPTAPGNPTPSKEERAGLTAAKMIIDNPKRFPAERVEKAKTAKANFERKYGGTNVE
jgi:hypothetical protein